MKCILVGYKLSQCVVPVNKYLAAKYLKGFDMVYLNYEGLIQDWGKQLAEFLKEFTDDYIIFSLDDFFVSEPIDMKVYLEAEKQLGGEVVCVKLCHATQQEHLEYPVVAQYCLWNREYLIWLLSQCTRPWDFEFDGMKLFKKKVLLRPCIVYDTRSAISGRWHGIRLDGLNDEDISYIKKNKLIQYE